MFDLFPFLILVSNIGHMINEQYKKCKSHDNNQINYDILRHARRTTKKNYLRKTPSCQRP